MAVTRYLRLVFLYVLNCYQGKRIWYTFLYIDMTIRVLYILTLVHWIQWLSLFKIIVSNILVDTCSSSVMKTIYGIQIW